MELVQQSATYMCRRVTELLSNDGRILELLMGRPVHLSVRSGCGHLDRVSSRHDDQRLGSPDEKKIGVQ